MRGGTCGRTTPSALSRTRALTELYVLAQIGLVASQFSLPMLAPLLFGTGILLRSIRTNASLIFPRIGVVVVLLWMLWFFNSVVQNTVVYLRRQVHFLGRLRMATRDTFANQFSFWKGSFPHWRLMEWGAP